MTAEQRAAKIDEIESLMDSLNDELARVPNSRWETDYAQYRLKTLVVLGRAREDLLAA